MTYPKKLESQPVINESEDVEVLTTPKGKRGPATPTCVLPQKKRRETQQHLKPDIVWNPDKPATVVSSTVLDEQWIETAHFELSSSSEVHLKAGTRELNLDPQFEEGSKKLSELQLKKKYR